MKGKLFTFLEFWIFITSTLNERWLRVEIVASFSAKIAIYWVSQQVVAEDLLAHSVFCIFALLFNVRSIWTILESSFELCARGNEEYREWKERTLLNENDCMSILTFLCTFSWYVLLPCVSYSYETWYLRGCTYLHLYCQGRRKDGADDTKLFVGNEKNVGTLMKENQNFPLFATLSFSVINRFSAGRGKVFHITQSRQCSVVLFFFE